MCRVRDRADDTRPPPREGRALVVNALQSTWRVKRAPPRKRSGSIGVGAAEPEDHLHGSAPAAIVYAAAVAAAVTATIAAAIDTAAVVSAAHAVAARMTTAPVTAAAMSAAAMSAAPMHLLSGVSERRQRSRACRKCQRYRAGE